MPKDFFLDPISFKPVMVELTSQQANSTLPANSCPIWIRGFLGRYLESRTTFAVLQHYQRLHTSHPTPTHDHPGRFLTFPATQHARYRQKGVLSCAILGLWICGIVFDNNHGRSKNPIELGPRENVVGFAPRWWEPKLNRTGSAVVKLAESFCSPLPIASANPTSYCQ